ncbi:MAG: hypothetical protein KDA51_14255 [Planctomycetales bacterium]|nr:hypothetical protein [Planctomycetales bacterium]MCA9206678.1 hypothetical protein [Planctomycetales bacterium]
MRFKTVLGLLLLSVVLLPGCSSGVKEETIEVKPSNDPLAMPRTMVQRYADGAPLGSEVTSFPNLVEALRESDPVRAEVLEKGLKEIQDASASARQAKAKELLLKLQPSME